MEELKSLFGEESLNFEQFSKKLGEAVETIKLANLKSGNYVSKSKYDKQLKSFEKYKSQVGQTPAVDNKLQSKFDNLQKEYNALKEKQDQADKMSLLNNSNVNPDFSEFVFSKVNSMTNESKDFKTCLDEYLGEHKQYLKASQHTFANLENGNGAVKSENQKINEQIRKMRG